MNVGEARYYRDADRLARAAIREHIKDRLEELKDSIR
jgi:hypothetical protein